MKTTILTITLTFLLGMQTVSASIKTDIEKANKAGNAVILVVTEPGNNDNAAAVKIAKDAQKLTSKTTVIEMNSADKENADLVIKYQLKGVLMPVIIVIANNGVLAGGTLLSYATPQNIAALIPSPKKAEILKAMNDGKAVFVVVSKKLMKKTEVLTNCFVACNDMKGNAKIVEVDYNDNAEKTFLNDLKITQIGTEPQIYVLNSNGQITGSFTGATDAKTLVATAAKKPASGCCPPGSSKKCK